MKPHIRMYCRGVWFCEGASKNQPHVIIQGCGKTPREAYDYWLKGYGK